ncbi:MAG: flavin monoamine oxidase family protein [Candidatus Binatia bacterium]
MSRTPLFSYLQRTLKLTLFCEEHQVSTTEGNERIAAGQWTRRQFLRTTAGVIAGTMVGSSVPERLAWGRTAPRIVIVGAGGAGLTCAYRLQQKGIAAQVIEAGSRVGGRMFSLRGAFPDRQLVELGGELIDTGHTALRRLVQELGLTLVDLRRADGEKTPVFFFDNRRVRQEEMVEAFRPIAKRIQQDLAPLRGQGVTYRHPRLGQALDRLSIAEWLETREVSGTLRSLLAAAFLGEFGLEVEEQSALNLLLMIGTAPGTLELFGDSDERYRIAEGNDSVPTRLAERLTQPVELDTRLEAVRRRKNGTYVLTVNQAGTVRDLEADRMVLTLPFSVLREVDLSKVDLPPVKRLAINTLGYGTHTKVMTGFTRRVWHETGSNGSSITDLPCQGSWDTSRGQEGTHGILTNFIGGTRGIAAGDGTPEERAAEFVQQSEHVFPGVQAAHTKQAVRFHWPGARLFRGSYACYKPGQYATIAGAEGEAVGGLHFAGEHTSLAFQGFMNGAVESGERVAQEILASVGEKRRGW